MKRFLIATALCAALAATHAAEVPRPGALDFRVRATDFTEGQVYKITGFFGFHAIVIFGPDEAIQKVTGYESGWKIESLGNKVLISPKLPDADSNLTVVTNRHVYFFDLTVKPFPKGKYASQANEVEQTYGLRFRYPEDDARAAAARAATCRCAANPKNGTAITSRRRRRHSRP